MMDWLKAIWKKFNPFDMDKYIHEMAIPLQEFREALEDIRHSNNVTIALLENELAEKEFILQQFVDIIPDMVWMKEYNAMGKGGKYVYANKAIRESLLLCPNPIGSTDVDLARRAKEVYGKDNHTFGNKCANTDLLTLENYLKTGVVSSRFLEHGKVKGKMMYLEVHKSVVLSEFGDVIGICGAGRILTEYIEAIHAIENINCGKTCCIEIKRLTNIFKKYQFDESEE